MSIQKNDEISAKIDSIIDDLFSVLNTLDGEKFYSFFSDQMVGIHSGHITESFESHKNAGIEFFNSLKEAKFKIVERTPVQVLSEDTAAWAGCWRFNGTDAASGDKSDMVCGQTYVFLRTPGTNEWKIVQAHISEYGGDYGPYSE